MSKRRSSPESSLELLLDTICNTFGGVLFLSILIVVLLRMSGRAQSPAPADRTSEAQMTVLVQQKADSAAKLESLEAAAKTQEQLQMRLARPELAGLADEVRRLERDRAALRSSREQAMTQIDAAQKSIEARAATKRDMDRQARELEQQVAEAEKRLENERAVRTTSARLPRLRNSTKREAVALVGNGRLYLLHNYDAGGMPTGKNTADVEITVRIAGLAKSNLKPSGGVPIAGSADAVAQMRQKLRGLDPQATYIAVAIWDDSYGHFQQLKKVFVELGFEYRLIPLAEGERVYQGGSGDSRVQ